MGGAGGEVVRGVGSEEEREVGRLRREGVRGGGTAEGGAAQRRVEAALVDVAG